MMPRRVSASRLLGSDESTVHTFFSAPSKCPRATSPRAVLIGEEVPGFCDQEIIGKLEIAATSSTSASRLILLRSIASSVAVLEVLVCLHFAFSIFRARGTTVRQRQLIMDVVAVGVQTGAGLKIGNGIARVTLFQLQFAKLVISVC